ncbi:MAG: UDP-glucose/GDP-mannose dehydrogenase family protein [Spirochaetes bacterium]|nr:UDP-glucose/GDP-mannose dehydrogenase family protein [Spirochaetota bacterium]
MRISVIGTGYVGLVVGTCFADMGNDVYCIDTNENRINDLKNGIMPIYEPGLDSLVIKNYNGGRLHFSTDIKDGLAGAEFIFIAVGTPPMEDGSADLQHVLAVAKQIGQNINNYKVIIDKSTVPVGTADKVREEIQKELDKRSVNIDFDVVSNPEFLKEGDAVNDFMKPDRVIIGADSDKAKDMMVNLYSVFFRQHPRCICMDVRSAEVTKYAANSMLATKISFMNEMSNFCEKVGADIENVRMGIGSDQRIGYSFIYPGIGYGGSCFPKDVKAIIKTSRENDYQMRLLESVEDVNNDQKSILANKIINYFDLHDESLQGKKIGLWGLSFKPETDDMREAPSIVIIEKLIKAGALIHAHDPKAIVEAKMRLGQYEDKIRYFEKPYDALEGCDVMALLTEWHLYRQPDFKKIKNLLIRPVVFDGRNQYSSAYLRENGFEYFGIGRK